MQAPEYHLKIKDLPEYERPRERLSKYGPEALSNSELLAIIISTGHRKESSVALAQRLLNSSGKSGLKFLIEAAVEELVSVPGIGRAKACQIKAAVELGRRISSLKTEQRPVIKTPEDVANLMMDEMRFLKNEYFKIIELNIKNQVTSVDNISVISIGSINASIVHPREVFNGPVKKGSAAIILVHNHPSGDPAPSKEDISVTERMVEAGKLLGIEVLDHLIIGDGIYLSMKEEGII